MVIMNATPPFTYTCTRLACITCVVRYSWHWFALSTGRRICHYWLLVSKEMPDNEMCVLRVGVEEFFLSTEWFAAGVR